MSTLEYYLQNPNFSHLSRTPFYDNDLGLDCNMSIAESDNYCRLPENEVKRLFEASCVESKEGPFVSDNTLLKALEHVDITSNKDPPSCNFANNDFNYDNYNKAMFAFPSYSNKTDTSQGLLNPSPFGPISSSMPDHYFSPPSFLPYHHDQACDKAKKRSPTITKKERRRTHSINSAFSALRNCIPNVPSDTKLSKIKTLRLATSYIAFLMNVIDKNDPKLAEMGFKADMSSSRRNENREEKRRREAQEILKASMKQADKQPKGRTGWPQQVWAAELK